MGPNLELLIGPYRSGKTSIAVKEVLRFCRRNPLVDSVIITPSARYRSLIEENVRKNAHDGDTAASGIMGLRFETFYRFVKNHSTASGAPAVIVSNRMRNGLLAHVLQTLNRQGRLRHLGRIAEMRGTASAVGALIDEFQRAVFSPEEVIAALRSTGDTNSRHMEFAEIYRCYHQELLNRDCLDEKFQAMQLCRLPAQDNAAGPNYGIVVFDGFDRYSRLHAQLAGGLSARCQKVLILFDYVPESDEYSWKKNSYEMLQDELSVDPRSVPARAHKPPAYECFTSLDRYIEMQEIVRQIKSLIMSGQAVPQDILVTARHIRPYLGAVTAAFENFGVPYSLDRPYPVNTFPITHFVQALLGLHVNKFLRQDVMAVLTSCYFDAAKSGFNPEEIENIDHQSLAKFVFKERSDWDRCLEEGKLKVNLNNLFDELTPSTEPKSLSSHCRWCEDKLELFAKFDTVNISDTATNSNAANISRTANISNTGTGSCLAAIRNAFAALIEEDRVLQPEPVDYATFYQKLLEVLEGLDFRSSATGNAHVTVCDAESVPNRTYKYVFIAGMLEGEFPAKDKRFNFAGPENLEAWRKRGVKVDNPRTHPGYEDALLKTITQSASEKVFMSCPRYDSKVNDKEELLPSFALRQFFENAEPEYVPVYERTLKFPCSLKDVASAVLWRQPDTNIAKLEQVLPGQLKYLRDLQDCIAPSKTRLVATRHSCLNGYLVDLVESGALLVSLPQYLSATSLNHYGECPFQFWGSDILKLSPREEVNPRKQNNLIGSFYHYVMEKFYKQVIEQDITVGESNRARLKTLFDAEVSGGLMWLESNPEFHADDFWTYRKNFLRLVLDKFFDYELASFSNYAADLKPYLCEADFGKGEKFPALKLEVDDGRTISIRGRIDRIDVNKDKTYARIVDYKSSKYGLSNMGVLTAQALQLPLYCLALTREIVPGCKISEAEYAVVGTAELRGVNGSSAVENSMDNAVQRVREYEKDIRRGNFLVQPRHKSNCHLCPQRKVCRIGELPTTGSDNTMGTNGAARGDRATAGDHNAD